MNAGRPIIVLHHGFIGFGEFELGPWRFSYFHKIDRALERLGYPVIATRVHPTASVVHRAQELKRIIVDAQRRMGDPARPIIIVGHSMGGLDARYMISHLGMADRVAALLTIATPHRGSPYAAWLLENLGRRLRGLKLVNALGFDLSGAHDLTPAGCARFNELTPNHPSVAYFSISTAQARRMMPPWALHSHKVISALEGENDGLVSVSSAQWGEHLETWRLDHWHSVNRRLLPRVFDPNESVIGRYARTIRLVESRIASARPIPAVA